MTKRLTLLALAAAAVTGIAVAATIFVPSGGTTSATGPAPEATATPAPQDGDRIGQMRSMMDSMHGEGSFDAMRQQMEQNNPGAFGQMLQGCPHGDTDTTTATPGPSDGAQGPASGQGMMGGNGGAGMMNAEGMMSGGGMMR